MTVPGDLIAAPEFLVVTIDKQDFHFDGPRAGQFIELGQEGIHAEPARPDIDADRNRPVETGARQAGCADSTRLPSSGSGTLSTAS